MDYNLIKEYCNRPTDSDENKVLQAYYTKVFGAIMPLMCGAKCMENYKAQILAQIEKGKSTIEVQKSINKVGVPKFTGYVNGKIENKQNGTGTTNI